MCVVGGYSNNSSSDISEVFSIMLPDSTIAQNVQFGPDKLRSHVVDLSFIVICVHQEIKALFCCITLDY